MMEESHFNSSYFWSPISTVPGQVGLNNTSVLMREKKYYFGRTFVVKRSPLQCQIENAMFLNKMKEQQDKSVSFPTSSPSHYQTAVLTIPTSGTKTDGGGQAGIVAPVHPSHSTQNLLPVPSTGIMTAGEFLHIKILSIAPIQASSCLCHRMTNYLVTVMHFNIATTPINPKATGMRRYGFWSAPRNV